MNIIFTALPNGEAQKISNKLKKHNILIDLSADFRLNNAKTYLTLFKYKAPTANTHRSPLRAVWMLAVFCVARV